MLTSLLHISTLNSYSLINQSHRQTPKEYSKKSGIQEKRKTALMPLKKIMFSGFKVDFGI